MTQQTNQHMDQQINPSQQDNKKQISFELIQAQETGMLFSPDFLVIYGLRGKSEISISSRQYKIETGGLLTAAPFTYLDYDCGADSGFSVLHISVNHYIHAADAFFSKDVVGTSTYDNARSFSCTFKDYLFLSYKDFILWALEIHCSSC